MTRDAGHQPDPEDVLTRAAPAPTTTVRYGDLPDQVADVWLPADPPGPAPLVLVIHGGFWRARYGRSIAAPMCSALVAEGYAAAAVEYRRTGASGPSAGGWPMTLDDLRTATELVPGLIRAATGRPTRPTVLVGHSAGGQLALWAGSEAQVEDLVGVVSLAGVCDLVRADELRLGARGDRGAVDALLGGRLADYPDRYAAADPMQLRPPGVPIVLVHGTEDADVPIELSRRYLAYVTATGGQVELVELPGVEHLGLIDPLSPAWPAVPAALRRLARPPRDGSLGKS